MNMTNSIITRVTLLFIFSAICFVLFVLYFISSEETSADNHIEQRYNNIIYTINELAKHGYNIKGIKSYITNMGFFEELDSDILKKNDVKYYLSYATNEVISSNMIKIAGHYYISLQSNNSNENTLYTDYKDTNDYLNYYFIALLGFITLVFFYISVLNSLLPLISLRKEVKKFSNGDMNIKTISNNNDEIGKLSEEFTKAAKTIDETNKARILFLRAIMHELKTPITKGFLVTEMIDNSKVKSRLNVIFKRINEVINDFARLEAISTKNSKIQKNDFPLTELLHNVNKMLIIEDERPRSVILDNRTAIIRGDFELMCLSVKNLIDNAVKYSSNKLVNIFVENNDLVIKNEGKPFKDNLENYFKPFYNDGEKNTSKGLGLGMYIIRNTTEAQGYKLDYKYIQGSHYFYIKDCIITKKQGIK